MFSRKFYFVLLLSLVGLTGTLVGCDCDEPRDLGSTRELEASPKSVTFDAQQGQEQEKLVRIIAKVGTTRIDSIELVRGKDYFSVVDGLPTEFPYELEEGQEIRLKVKYTAPGDNISPIGTIRVTSDSTIPSDGKLDIQLLAQSNSQRLVVTPNPVDFKVVEQGKTKTIEVVAKNDGTGILKIEKIEEGEKNSQGFTYPDGLPTAPKELKPGESFTFKITYTPTTTKPDLGQILFTCEGNCAPEDPDPTKRKDPYVVELQGALATPSILVEPQQLSFGFVESGKTVGKKFKISNVGSANLDISEIAFKAGSSGAFLMPTISNVTIEPGSSKEVAVQYRPSIGSEDKGTIEVKSNDPARPVVPVQVVGKVSAPDISVTPTKLNFGKVPNSKTLSVNIKNTGDKPLIVNAPIMVPGTSPEFSFDKAPAQITVQPNGVAQLAIKYTPKDKVPDTGKVQLKSNDPDTPTVEITLLGDGIGDSGCDLVAAPNRVNFGTTVLGSPKTQQVKLSNVGTQDCLISKMSTSTVKGGFPLPYNGPDVFHLPNLQGCPKGVCSPPLTVKAGNSMTVEVSFLPIVEKPKNPFGGTPAFEGSLGMEVNMASPTINVPLSGIASKSCVEIVPNVMNFGLVQINCSSRNEKLQIFNTCSTNLVLNKVTFRSTSGTSSNKGFRITQLGNLPITIAPAQSAEVQLAYKASAASTDTDTLDFHHSVTYQSPTAVPLTGKGTTDASQTDTFKQATKPQIDILFVIDDSGSMGDEQRNLGNNFTSFIKWALTLNVDFQIAITTTDVSGGSGNPFGGPQTTPGGFRGSPKIMTNNTPNLTTIFSQNATVGTQGSGNEQGLEGARLALSAPLITTGANKGFLRKDASLSIIFISDEADSSGQPVQFYQNFFKNIKGVRNPDRLRVNGIIGYDPATKQPKCGGNTGGNAGAQSSGRYLAVINSTQGVVESICNANWAQTLSNIASVTFGLKKKFFLTRAADPKSIVVKVDGVVVNTSSTTWTYDTVDNGINFNKPPKAGSTVQVEYKAICF
ncbi:MAG: hypothetical protein CL920_25255 [Deltaproteobacteria bacterium]|nr:hypothetical protein [Deltaproteobacteria bacterium]MBU52014.1 hypothetical protein [Deltaproteobacteria bacterium]